MTVAVVIATRDRRDSLADTLERLEALPDRPEVVVVDNGSTDGSVAAARRPGVRVIECGRNLGAAARTIGARAAEAQLVAFSDDDSWWAPGSLARAAELFERHPRLGLIAARIVVEPLGRLDPTCRAMARSPLPRDDGLPGAPVLGFVACGAIVRRGAFLDAGGFEPRFEIGAEEKLLALDLAAAGWRLAYVDDVVAHHRPDPGERPGRRQRILRNELWTAWLRRPPVSAARRTASLLAAADGDARPAFMAALRGLPWVTRRRRVVPRHVDRELRMLERSPV